MPNQYYINRNDRIRGPFSEERLRELHAEGKLRDSDFVSTQNDGGWEPVEMALSRRNAAGRKATKAASSKAPSATRGSRKRLWLVMGIGVAALTVVGVWLGHMANSDVDSNAAGVAVFANTAPLEVATETEHSPPGDQTPIESIAASVPRINEIDAVEPASAQSILPSKAGKNANNSEGRETLPVQKILSSEVLSRFTASIMNETHRQNFTAATRQLIESQWGKTSGVTTTNLVIGQVIVPDEKLLSQLSGLAMPLKGGYFAAIVGHSNKGKLPFYAPGCRPVFVPVDGVPVDGVLDVGSHQMSPAGDEDLIPIRLQVVDEAGKPLPAGHVTANCSLGLKGHESYHYKPGMFGFSSIDTLHSWNDRRFLARDGTKGESTVNKKLHIADDGTIEFRSELGPLQLVFVSPPKQTQSLGVGLLAYSSAQPTDLGQVILHDKLECKLTEIRSADGTFHDEMEVSGSVVPGEVGHLDMTTMQQQTGLRRYLQLSQLERQLNLEQFYGSIEGIAELGEGPIVNYRDTEISKVKLSSLSEFNRTNWVPTDYESGSNDRDSFEANPEQKLVRAASGPTRDESVQINSGRVYVVKIGPRIENKGLPLWVMFTVSDVKATSGVLPSPGASPTANNSSDPRNSAPPDVVSLLKKLVFKDGSEVVLLEEQISSPDRLVASTLRFMEQRMQCRFAIDGLEPGEFQSAEKLSWVVHPPKCRLFQGVRSVRLKMVTLNADTFREAIVYSFLRLAYGNGFDTGHIPDRAMDGNIAWSFRKQLRETKVEDIKKLSWLAGISSTRWTPCTEAMSTGDPLSRDAWASFAIDCTRSWGLFVCGEEFSAHADKISSKADLNQVASQLSGEWESLTDLLKRPDLKPPLAGRLIEAFDGTPP